MPCYGRLSKWIHCFILPQRNKNRSLQHFHNPGQTIIEYNLIWRFEIRYRRSTGNRMAEILLTGVSCFLSEFLEVSKTWSAWSTALSSEFCRGKVMLIMAEGYQREDCYLQNPKPIRLHQFWSTTVGYIINGSNSPAVIFHSSFEITLNPCICFSKPTDGKGSIRDRHWNVGILHQYLYQDHIDTSLLPKETQRSTSWPRGCLHGTNLLTSWLDNISSIQLDLMI